MNTAQVGFGIAPLPRVRVGGGWEGVTKDSVGRTLSELGEQLGNMAGPRRLPILLMVDNLDAATHPDLVALINLSATLRENRQPAFLIGAGGQQTESRLRTASAGHGGTATTQADKLDVRELMPLTDDQMRRALVRPLERAGFRCEPAAVDTLTAEARGHPGRLRTLAGAALELVRPGDDTITADIAVAASARLNTRSQALYAAAWTNCTPHEMTLLARTAAHGSRGIPIPSRTENPDRWNLDDASTALVSRGLLTRTGDRIHVTDPGFQDWVQTRLGATAAQSGIAHPALAKTAPRAQLTATGERAPELRPSSPARDLHTGR